MAIRDNTSYLGEENPQQGNNDSNKNIVYTRPPIGYADGYATYTSKSGAHNTDGSRNDILTKKGNGEENVKSQSLNFLPDSQSNLFRRINGFGSLKNDTSDSYEDPTYLIFDISINKTESPLFNNVSSFMSEYSDYVPEIAERVPYYDEFINMFFKVFPSDVRSDTDGRKKHYIEQISNLDVLLKPIINYPDDVITIVLSEDITLNTQYLAELYNNLIYSYDSHRYLIPDNLLRFDMRITFRDIRNFKKVIYQGTGDDTDVESSYLNDNVSKFVYILHDCQLDFMPTRVFGNDFKIGGFGTPANNTPASAAFNINFKSYSKITAPLLIDNSKIIDFKERETTVDNNGNHDKEYYTNLDGDYLTHSEYTESVEYRNNFENVNYRSVNNITSGGQSNAFGGGFQIPDINSTFRGFSNIIKEEIIEVRNVIVKQIYEEVNQLITEGQRFLGETLGFTLGKTNVYYDSVREKITRFGYFFEDILDDSIDILKNTHDSATYGTISKNLYSTDNTSNRVDILNDVTVKPSDSIYYGNGDAPSGDITNLNEDGDYNAKYPDGDVHVDGIYHSKEPIGKVYDDIEPIERKLEGDVHDDGQYNIKYPSGKVHENGQYIINFPDSDVHDDGQYNNKFPNGNLYK